MALGMSQEEADNYDWRGTTEGGKIKSGGTHFWVSTDACVTNSTLLSILPAGWLSGKSFVDRGSSAIFWTSTQIMPDYSWYRMLVATECRIYRRDGYQPNGTSVRCIRDK
jgi:uncharacterized protein (TIGR02145 family)